ncbi:hypothetical protein QBC35DRAFT_543823 [Podospora australis]|uniref:Secreted protein n=1 Tax=Podospora australis TaxID=1536484 RepID=A0AAN7ACB9_9PEZI|nr:hypothetical protein QBC35DRAFT_543823 [Podospora australis]
MGLLSLSTALLVAAASTVSADSASAPAAQPRISSISYSGNGCIRDPQHYGGFSDPTFKFNNFAASLPGTNRTLNCEVHVVATGASPGWQVALASNNVKGHVVLGPGTKLDYFTTVFFSEDAAKTGTVRGRISNNGGGTIDQGVTLVSNTGANKVWSPCTGASGSPGILNVNFRGALTGDGKAYFEALTESWDLEWRRC